MDADRYTRRPTHKQTRVLHPMYGGQRIGDCGPLGSLRPDEMLMFTRKWSEWSPLFEHRGR